MSRDLFLDRFSTWTWFYTEHSETLIKRRNVFFKDHTAFVDLFIEAVAVEILEVCYV
jgi:hypothetical protein